MTSEERREGRYQRRKAKRIEKHAAALAQYNFEVVADPNYLYKAMLKARKGVYWKTSVQRYNMQFLRKILQASKDLHAGKDVRKGFIHFYRMDRGKIRNISSVHFQERVIQRSACANAFIPLIARSFINDNGASLKGKGLTFAVNRLKKHLKQHFKEHGLEGYVILVDFKGYFENIQHKYLFQIYEKALGIDEKLFALAKLFVAAFGTAGIGLGSETSQINAMAYTDPVDHYIKEVLRCKYYGRYMDDSYIICDNKQHAKDIMAALLVKYQEYELIASPKKTTIVKMTRGFTFLKIHFNLTETGRIIMRPGKASAKRQRRKLKKFKKFYDAGVMTMEQIQTSYTSWRGCHKGKKARRTLYSMDVLYHKLFGGVIKNGN